MTRTLHRAAAIVVYAATWSRCESRTKVRDAASDGKSLFVYPPSAHPRLPSHHSPFRGKHAPPHHRRGLACRHRRAGDGTGKRGLASLSPFSRWLARLPSRLSTPAFSIVELGSVMRGSRNRECSPSSERREPRSMYGSYPGWSRPSPYDAAGILRAMPATSRGSEHEHGMMKMGYDGCLKASGGERQDQRHRSPWSGFGAFGEHQAGHVPRPPPCRPCRSGSGRAGGSRISGVVTLSPCFVIRFTTARMAPNGWRGRPRIQVARPR